MEISLVSSKSNERIQLPAIGAFVLRLYRRQGESTSPDRQIGQSVRIQLQRDNGPRLRFHRSYRTRRSLVSYSILSLADAHRASRSPLVYCIVAEVAAQDNSVGGPIEIEVITPLSSKALSASDIESYEKVRRDLNTTVAQTLDNFGNAGVPI